MTTGATARLPRAVDNAQNLAEAARAANGLGATDNGTGGHF
jgi:hypothetical protein